MIETRRNALLERARRAVPANLRGRLDLADVVQEVLAAAWASFASFHGNSESELEVWLSAILTNTIRDARRAHHCRRRDIAREASPGAGRRIHDERCPPVGVDPIVVEEEAAQVRRSREGLPGKHRRVLRLRFTLGAGSCTF